MRARSLVLSLALLAGCHSAGPYGYARSYSPLSAEQDAAGDAREYDPVMAERDKADWKKSKISVFGIVGSRAEGAGGSAYLKLSVRTLEQRNLCEELDEETCRVTVSEHEHAVVHVLVKLKPEDDLGERSLAQGSLLRIIGKLGDDVDPDDGTPIVQAQYYRHWPRHFFRHHGFARRHAALSGGNLHVTSTAVRFATSEASPAQFRLGPLKPQPS